MNKDIVSINNGTLYLHFLETGERQRLILLPLSSFHTIYQKENEIRIHNGNKSLAIEQFSSERLATNAYKKIQRFISRYLFIQCLAKNVKRGILWFILPLLGYLFALTLYSGINAPHYAVRDISSLPITNNLSQQPQQSLQQSYQIPEKENLAALLNDAVQSGQFSIQLSKGSQGVLYVFSDPLCPYCKNLEAELEKLYEEYTIYIFPVSVVSNDLVLSPMAEIFCVTEQNLKQSLWKDLISDSYQIPSSTCSNGINTINTNNTFFKAMNFAGTPTLINQKGIQVPDTIPNTASAVKNWMSNYD